MKDTITISSDVYYLIGHEYETQIPEDQQNDNHEAERNNFTDVQRERIEFCYCLVTKSLDVPNQRLLENSDRRLGM